MHPLDRRHNAEHRVACSSAILRPPVNDLIRTGSRRWMLQCGLAGLGGLSAIDLLRCRSQAGGPKASFKTIILFWLSGGPSQFEFWDPKRRKRAPPRQVQKFCLMQDWRAPRQWKGTTTPYVLQRRRSPLVHCLALAGI